MPVPIALSPVAVTALRYGAVAALAWYVARRSRGPAPARWEDTLDTVKNGAEVRNASTGQERRWLAAARLRRVIRAGRTGPGLELDLSALARLRLRPLRGSP